MVHWSEAKPRQVMHLFRFRLDHAQYPEGHRLKYLRRSGASGYHTRKVKSRTLFVPLPLIYDVIEVFEYYFSYLFLIP